MVFLWFGYTPVFLQFSFSLLTCRFPLVCLHDGLPSVILRRGFVLVCLRGGFPQVCLSGGVVLCAVLRCVHMAVLVGSAYAIVFPLVRLHYGVDFGLPACRFSLGMLI